MKVSELTSGRSPFAVLAGGLLLGCLLPLCVSSCSSTGETDGVGGTSGGSGPAGSGGGGAPPPVCSGSTDTVQLSLVGPNGMPVEAPVTAAVTVVSVESCTAAPCPSALVSTTANKILLADASEQQWTLYLQNSSMPSNLIEAGDAFDLVVDAAVEPTFYRTINQTVVLARDGNLIVFAASTYQFYSLHLPVLTAFGIGIADEGQLCDKGISSGCYVRPHAARVSVGGASAVIASGETRSIGWLSLSNAVFTVFGETGGCDGKSRTLMAGFRL